jgi:metalloprotein, YbeY/UPF0054 family
MKTIRFFTEKTSFKLLHPIKTSRWIKQVIQKSRFQLEELNYIFCTDDYLLEMNQSFLNHNTFTDIITFDHSTQRSTISGEIYISVDRVKENARSFKVDFETELHRVMIHGVLHLTGLKDKTKEQKIAMRKKEEACLSLRK